MFTKIVIFHVDGEMQNICQSFFLYFLPKTLFFLVVPPISFDNVFGWYHVHNTNQKRIICFFSLSMFKMCCIEKVKRKQYQLLFLSLFYFNVFYFILISGLCLLFYLFIILWFYFSFLCILFNFIVWFYFFILSFIYTFWLLLGGFTFEVFYFRFLIFTYCFSYFDFTFYFHFSIITM